MLLLTCASGSPLAVLGRALLETRGRAGVPVAVLGRAGDLGGRGGGGPTGEDAVAAGEGRGEEKETRRGTRGVPLARALASALGRGGAESGARTSSSRFARFEYERGRVRCTGRVRGIILGEC